MSALGVPTGGGAGIGRYGFKFNNRRCIDPTAAKGGTVPPGYPNDTYPALLTSGERVIPKGLDISSMGSVEFEPVELVIKDNTLSGILKKANKKQSIY